MTDSFVGEIRMFGFRWAPSGWALCEGTVLSIQQNAALYALIGKTFGGDGKTTFALPDLRGRTWLGAGAGFVVGTASGDETIALDLISMPQHTHAVEAYDGGGSYNPNKGGALYATAPSTAPVTNLYGAASGTPQLLNPGTVDTAGSGAKHNNMQPFAVVNFCICTAGDFPTRP
ncbi:MAG: tail fiber protein [Azospirillaceae bacterium]|nr:tail fiber protein [Azospirillaceae bacterium]